MISAYAVTVSTALLLGCIGLWWTTMSKRTSTAGALSYASVFILLIGAPVYASFTETIIRDYRTGGGRSVVPIAHLHYVLLVCLGVILIAIAAAVVIRGLLRQFKLPSGRRAGWVIFGLAAAGLSFGVARPLLAHSAWYPDNMAVMLAPNPFMVMATVVAEFGRYGPWPSSILSDNTVYWVGAVVLYLAVAVDLLALTIYQFERQRAKALG
jgi:hypothetical protein